jgi:hypothetical protein
MVIFKARFRPICGNPLVKLILACTLKRIRHLTSMPIHPRAAFAVVAAASALLGSCMTYDPPPQASKPVPADVDTWQKISTRSWKATAYEKREKALQILKGKDWLRIDATQRDYLMADPTPVASPIGMTVPPQHQIYLVRGRGYGAFGGKVRFQPKTRELSVFLASYNGEMLIPGMHHKVKDIPVIVALPTAPTKVHQSAQIGGDSILSVTDRD